MDMSKNKTVSILKAADAGKYGVPAMACYSMQHILGVIRGAESARSPAIVMLFPHALVQYGPLLVNFASAACRSASVPVALHLDHEQSESRVRYAASLPFDSIMIDMSHHELEENLAKTAQLTAYCHARGIAVEAEAGRIQGAEDGLKDTTGLESILTTEEMAAKFVDTRIDFLAPCIGNAHGISLKDMRPFDYERLKRIYASVSTRVQLVLHGTTGDTEVRQSIAHGVVKVNMNRQLEIWDRVMREKTSFLPATELIDEEIEVVRVEVERLCGVCGSAGKA